MVQQRCNIDKVKWYNSNLKSSNVENIVNFINFPEVLQFQTTMNN